MSDVAPYNPLDKKNLGSSVADALLGKEPVALGAVKRFKGAGVYAIYYSGQFPAYRKLAERNGGADPQAPIYVGKAIPEGGRKGSLHSSPGATTALWRRLKEHADSIKAVASLDIAEFKCRYLVVDDIWIPLGESLLIARFAPLWNTLLDGFGNHDPGAGRYKGLMPRWDVLHPGRSWAVKCQPRIETASQLSLEIEAMLDQEPSLARSRFRVEQERATYAALDPDDE